MKPFLKFIIAALFLSHYLPASAQNISLKKPLSKEDLKALDLQLNECLAYESNTILTFNTWDFYDNKNVVPDTLNSMKQVSELQKKLKDNYKDAVTYNNIGMVYKGMFMFAEADKNFTKAAELTMEYVKKEPDSAAAHNLMAAVYTNQGKFIDAIASFEKVYKLDKHDSIAKFMIPMCYSFALDFAAAKASLNRFLNRPEDDYDHLCVLTVTNYWEKMMAIQQMQQGDVEKMLKDKGPKEILDFTKIDELCGRNRNKIEFELVNRFNRQIALFLKSYMITIASKDYNSNNPKFKIYENDIAELNELEAFYTKCISDTAVHAKYILYKSLANIELLRGNFIKSISYSQTAIKLKPLSKTKFDNNAAADYDNVAAAYFLVKDTAGYEKAVKEKFAAKPAINPLPEDYASMVKISFFHKDYADAKKFSEEALKMNPKLEEPLVCLAALNILNGDIKGAYKMLDSLYTVNPQNYSIYIMQGICSLHENDVTTAYASFKRVRDMVVDPAWIDKEILERFFLVK